MTKRKTPVTEDTSAPKQAARGRVQSSAALAARARVESAYCGDLTNARNFGVTDRTIKNWCARLGTDPQLSGFFHDFRLAYVQRWQDRINDAMAAGIGMIMRLADSASHVGDADIVGHVIEGMRLLAEVQMVGDMINARVIENKGRLAEIA